MAGIADHGGFDKIQLIKGKEAIKKYMESLIPLVEREDTFPSVIIAVRRRYRGELPVLPGFERRNLQQK